MRHRALGLLLAFTVAGAPGLRAQTPEPPAPPLDAAPPALRLDPALAVPVSTAVELTVVPERETFSGRVRLDIDVKKTTSVLWLNAAELDIHGAVLERGDRRWDAEILPGGTDFVGFRLPEPVPPGRVRLTVDYEGAFERTDTTGLFKQQDGGRWYVFTQMEPTDARRAFPCFDEPSYKTPWQVTLHVEKGQVAVSNTPVESETDEPDGMKAVVFRPTPPLPSYLVALGVGPFDLVDAGRAGVGRTPLRMVVGKGRGAETAHAVAITGDILERLETYFAIPYPYEKLDSLAIPQTVGFGAMENVGLITYVDRLLLIEPDEASEQQRRAYARVGAHEIAHQWFGNLVTMEWWDDIWLNEGFATWMAGRILEDWKPEWGGALDEVERRATVMIADGLVSARRVRQPIENEGDIRTAFDGITYRKGGSLLSMYEEWMGRETFRKGIHRYLTAHAGGNATSSDFLAALGAEGGKEIASSFASFLDQAGAPVLSVELRCPDGETPVLRLGQRRFLPLGSAGAPTRQTWDIPVRVRYSAAGKEGSARVLMSTAEGELRLHGAAGCPDWVQANDSGLGYYLVDYERELLARLLADGAPHLTAPERVGLLGDAHLLTTSGDLPVDALLAALPPFARSGERQVVEVAVDVVERLRELVPAGQRPRYAALVRDLFGARAHELGWTARPGDDEETRLLRPKVVGLVATLGEDPVLRAEAARVADAWLAEPGSVDPEVAGAALVAAARAGGAELFDRMLAAAQATADSRDRRRLLLALGSFEDPALVDRALAFVLTPGFDIREATTLLEGVHAEPAGRERSFAWLQRSFDVLVERLPRQRLGRTPELAKDFCDSDHAAQVERFFEARNVHQYDGGTRMLAQALERIRLCAAYREAQAPAMARFFAAD